MNKNSAFLYLLLISVVLPLFAGVYPDWFLYPDHYGKDYIVGYSFGGEDPVVDAERTWTAYKECIVNGKLEYYGLASQDVFLRNSDYYYNFSPDSLEIVKGKLKAVDAFLMSTFTEDIVVLFHKNSSPEINATWVDTDSLMKPAWSEKTFWEDDHYYYGVGSFSARGNPNDAWKTAEERALFNILSNYVITFHQISQVTSSEKGLQEVEKISVIKVRYRLKNIEVWERWPDNENFEYMAVVRIPITDIFSPDAR